MTAPSDSPPIPVTAAPHPFRVERRELTVPAGLTLAEILAEAQPDPVLRRHAHVEVGGVAVAPEWYPYLRPKTYVLIRTLPAGGGGDGEKNPLRTVLLIGVAVVSGGIASAGWASMGGWFTAGSASALALGAATSLVGRALINQVAPPPRPDEPETAADDPVFSVEGMRNRLKPYGAVPRVYGRHRYVPPYAAKPFTEVEGDEQYFRALFLWGYGPLEVDDVRIGSTPITDFDEVEVETVTDNGVEGNPSLFSKSVDERSLNVGLTNAAGYQQRRTDDVADEISVDVAFPRGLFELSGGNRLSRTVTIDVEYAEAGTDDWQGAEASFASQTLTFRMPGSYTDYATSRRITVYGTTTYRQKFLVVVDAFTGDARYLASSKYTTSTSFSSIPRPSEPNWGHQLAVVHAEGSDIVDVNQLSNADVTGFAVSKQDADTVSIDAGTNTSVKIVVTEKSAEAVRRSLRIRTGDGTKRYDVRLKRETADHSVENDIFDESIWTKLRAIQFEEPVAMTGVALTAIRIRATDQLSGTIQELNGVVQSILPEFDADNDVWVSEAASGSPGSAFRDVLTGDANGRAVALSRVDLTAIEDWVAFTADRALGFNHVFDRDGTVTDALDAIASVGRASKSITDGFWSVTVDKEKSTVVQHFTPRNTFDFRAEKAFSRKTHALRVRFLNADQDWQQDELVVFNDGFTEDGNPPDEEPPFPDEDGGYAAASVYEGLRLTGVTSEEQAFREGRYHLAVDQLRPEVYTFKTDVEHLVATRGDLVRMTHDVPEWGTGFGRVKSVTTNSAGEVDEVTLDAVIDLTAGQDYVVRFRLADGSTKLVDVVDPGSDVATDAFTPEEPIASAQPQAGDLAMVGVKGQESVELLVKSVRPTTELAAQVTAVDYSPAVFGAFDENIPAFDPRLTEPDVFVGRKPPEPRVLDLQSDENVALRQPDGGVIARIVASFEVPSDVAVPADEVQMRYRKSDSASSFSVARADVGTGRIVVADVDQGDSYRVELRSLTRAGVASDWVVAAATHKVLGTSARPPDVTGFELEIIGQGVYLRWDAVNVFDLDHYELRFSQLLSGASWVSSVVLRDAVPAGTTETAGPGQVGTYLIKAVDRGGRKSANATAIASNATEVLGLNVVESRLEDPDFPGVRTDVFRTDDYLQLSPANSIDAWTDVTQATVPRLDFYAGDLAAQGVYDFEELVDLGQVYTSRVSSAIEANGINMANFLSGWGAMSNLDPLSAQEGDEWDATIEVRTTDGDPTSSDPGWSEWQELQVGDYTARAFDFRLVLDSFNQKVAPRVTRLEAEVDMPDRVEGQDDVVVSDGTLAVSYDPAFKEKPSLGHTTEDLNGGEFVVFKNKTRSGFDVEIRDGGGSLVSGDRTLTWVAKGFGKEVVS